MLQPVLDVRDLATYFFTERGVVRAVDGVSFRLYPGETLGVVGESGCGKSMTALSIMGLVPRPGRIVAGEIRLMGEDLVGKPDRELRRLRGSRMAMIFQDPLTTLNPVLRVGQQVTESIRIHYGDGTWSGGSRRWSWLADPLGLRRRRIAWERAVEMLDKVGIPAPSERMRAYPHEMSGGMRQRIMIAIALSCSPALLLADEPTTALDVTIQAQILDLMRRLQEEMGTSILLITHDFGVVSELCDRVMVMYAGKVVETGPLDAILNTPRHPYTQGLLASIPRLGDRSYRLKPIEGTVPELHALPPGCSYCTRCPVADEYCAAVAPQLKEISPHHHVACHKVAAAPAMAGEGVPS
ncbi:MAG: peptide ABC transporter ATP-binding protein [Firmicutes bacterium ZCTH02-B6]|nr:MAG: peptide ABC transporter ATP-binding protein [Firmicutes bacterium ZCTH02-B6]